MDDTTSRHRFFHAFCVNPDITFETQQKDEKVVLILRAHPITQITWVINSIILVLLLSFTQFFISQFLNVGQIVLLNIAVIIFIISYIWLSFLTWYFNVGIVTNKRIVDVDFSNVLYKEISTAQLEKVEEVTIKSAGYFGSIFNYGSLYIQTAGEEVNIEFINIPDPAEASRIINQLLP